METTQPKILIVEDDPDQVFMYRRLLNRVEISNITAPENFEEALSLMETEPFDCVLIDGLNGGWPRFVDRAQEKGIRAIVVSAQTEAARAGFKTAVEAKGAEFIDKLFFFNKEIFDPLVESLGQKRRGKEAGGS